MQNFAGNIWMLFFCFLILLPMSYTLLHTEKRLFSFQMIAIACVFIAQFLSIAEIVLTDFCSTKIRLSAVHLSYQLTLVLTIAMIFYLVLGELKEKFMRYQVMNDWGFCVPAVFECSLLVFFYVSSVFSNDDEAVRIATSVSLYFIISFYILVGAWLCYKSSLYNLDFDIKFIARKHFNYYIFLFVAILIQEVIFFNIAFAPCFAVFLLFNFMTRSRTLISQDALSGVNNRVSFNKYINNVFLRGDHDGAYIVFIDIDRFKHINDTYGHLEGDDAIAIVGKTLKSIAGETNSFVARFGGDEFVLVKQKCDEEMVKHLIQSITYELEERLIFSDKQYDITVSCGYVEVKPGVRNIRELMSNADKRMYEVKQQKKMGAYNGIA
ncbi:MAG: GGDEF domain-containing protein [Succinivibrio sp.]